MNKSLEALLRGYVLFNVNGKRFFLYNSARNYRMSITSGDLEFIGFSVVKGWIGFYYRFDTPKVKQCTH